MINILCVMHSLSICHFQDGVLGFFQRIPKIRKGNENSSYEMHLLAKENRL